MTVADLLLQKTRVQDGATAKESWFQSGLSQHIEILQQQIRSMHDHELQIARLDNRQDPPQIQISNSSQADGEAQDCGHEPPPVERSEVPVGLSMASQEYSAIISLGEPINHNNEFSREAPSSKNKSSPSSVEFNRRNMLVHPLSQQMSRGTDVKTILGNSDPLESDIQHQGSSLGHAADDVQSILSPGQETCGNELEIGPESSIRQFSPLINHPLRSSLQSALNIDVKHSASGATRSRTLTKLMEEAEINEISGTVVYFQRFWGWYDEESREDAWLTILDVSMGFIIFLNVVLVGIRMDFEDWSGWQIVDLIFVILFVLELSIKFKFLGWRDLLCGKFWAWNLFDILITAFAIGDLIADTGSVAAFRVLRLGRTLRLVRLIRMSAVKELVMLLRGVMAGIKCLFWCLAALALPVYLLGILLSNFLHDWEEDNLFSSVPAAMFTTIRCMCGDCNDGFGRPIILQLGKTRGWSWALFYAIFILVSIFGVFNLITAIFIEGTMQVVRSDTYLQRQLRQSSDKKFARNIRKLVFMFYSCAKNGRLSTSRITSQRALDKFCITEAMDLQISQHLYDEMVSLACVREVMDDMGLQDDDIVDLFQMLDVDNSGTVDLHELVTGIHKLRGDATKRDLVALAYMIYSMQGAVRTLSLDVGRLESSQRLHTWSVLHPGSC